MTNSFENRKAVVLGGTSGIGLATARRLAEAGAQVLIGGRSEARLAQALEQLTEQPVRGATIDVLDRDALARLFEQEGPIDLLVNAATGGERAVGPFASMDLNGFRGSFDKLWGYSNSVHAVLPHLSTQGAIVLVGGAPARKCPPGFAAISTVGNAVEGFCRAIAAEIAPRRINVVAPGIIDTPMFPVEGPDRKAFLDQATAGHLLQRAGTPDEVADAILFAAGNAFVTGTTIDVDGGMLLP